MRGTKKCYGLHLWMVPSWICPWSDSVFMRIHVLIFHSSMSPDSNIWATALIWLILPDTSYYIIFRRRNYSKLVIQVNFKSSNETWVNRSCRPCSYASIKTRDYSNKNSRETMKILSLLIATAHSISASEEADCPSVANTANKAMIRIIYSNFQCVLYKKHNWSWSFSTFSRFENWFFCKIS